jgi:hypothetical protein
MNKPQERALRAERCRVFDPFDPGLDQETKQEMATAWAAWRRGTECDDRSAALLWNLIDVFPEDEGGGRCPPEEFGYLLREWRDALEGRPEWSFGAHEEEG